jgi:hypothetical protein
MAEKTVLQEQVYWMVDHLIGAIGDYVDEKLGDNVNYRLLNGVMIHIEDMRFDVSDQLDEIFAKYIKKYGPIQ